jgi:hypothetical protein
MVVWNETEVQLYGNVAFCQLRNVSHEGNTDFHYKVYTPQISISASQVKFGHCDSSAILVPASKKGGGGGPAVAELGGAVCCNPEGRGLDSI